MAVAKHFPGHGDTDVDSHLALPLIRHSAARIDTVELYPFRQLFEAGIPGVMIAHLNVPSYDTANIPASLSKQIITDLLRDKLHFDGLCFTDAMNMKGVTKGRTPGEADVEALSSRKRHFVIPGKRGSFREENQSSHPKRRSHGRNDQRKMPESP